MLKWILPTHRRWAQWLWMVAYFGFVGALEPHKHDDKSVEDPTTNRHITEDQLKRQTEVVEYVCVAGLTLYCWEYLVTLDREISMWLHPRRLLHPQVLLFLLIRYATVPTLVVTSYSTWGHFVREDQCVNREQLSVAVVQFVVACVFSWRTIAIWRRTRWVVAFMVTFALLLFGASIGLLYFSHDSLLASGACRPSYDQNSNPDSVSDVNTVMWFYLIGMIFDTTAVVLSTYKLVVYANMGREIQKITFRDPFEMHRQQLEKGKSVSDPDMHGIDPFESQAHSSPTVYRRVSDAFTTVFFLPMRATSDILSWWHSLTPLVARLLRNGIFYFVVATAYNLNNFILEAEKSLHSKSFLALYAPLMCVMCQRLLLVEFDEVWTPYDPDVEYPGRQLVDRIMGPMSSVSRSGHGELARFDRFASALEEHHASIVTSSPTRGPLIGTASPPRPIREEKCEENAPSLPRVISPASSPFSSHTSTMKQPNRPPSAMVATVTSTPPQKLTLAQEQQALHMAGML